MATHKPQLLLATHPTSSLLPRHPPPQGTGQADKTSRSMHGLVGGSNYYNQSGVRGEGTVLEKGGAYWYLGILKKNLGQHTPLKFDWRSESSKESKCSSLPPSTYMTPLGLPHLLLPCLSGWTSRQTLGLSPLVELPESSIHPTPQGSTSGYIISHRQCNKVHVHDSQA